MSKAQCKIAAHHVVRSSHLNREEMRLVHCYRSLSSRDRYAMRCLIYAYEEMTKLHTAAV